MKQIILSFGLFFIMNTLNAQSVAGIVVADKKDQPAAIIELPYEASLVSKAIHEYLSPKGKAQGKEIKGFKAYKNPNAHSDSINANLYFLVKTKKNEKNVTVLSLLMTRKGNEVATGSDMHHMDMAETIRFLNDLAPVIEAYTLNARIKEQEAVVLKAANKFKDLVDSGKELQQKKLDVEKKINTNQVDQTEQQTIVDAEKAKLNALMSSRKS
jgi:hypothetical protein